MIAGLSEAIRAGSWHGDYMLHEAVDFLGCPFDQVSRIYHEYVGKYLRNLIVASLEKFLEVSGYTIVSQRSIGSSGIQIPKLEDIEIAPKVFKGCLTEGCFFLQKGDLKLILAFENSYSADGWWVNAFYKNTSAEVVKSFLQELEAFAKKFNYLRKAKIDADLTYIEHSDYSWDDIILPAKTKAELRMNIGGMINNIDLYKKNDIKFKRGIILKGPPGTGKTLIGKIICHSVDSTFIWVTPRHLERSSNVKHICDMARELSPTILFLEDIDLYSEDRHTVRNSSILGELMNQLDGIVENHFVIVIATTNRVDDVEEAIRNRPGRFDRILDIGLPTHSDRLRMLQLFTKNYTLDGVDLEELATKTEGYSGAHVKELVITAAIEAIDGRSVTSDGLVILKHDYFMGNITKVRNKKMAPTPGFGPSNDDDDDEYHIRQVTARPPKE